MPFSTVIVSLIDSLFFHTSDSKGFFLSTPVHFRIVSIVARCLMQTNDSFDICKNQSKQLIRCSHLVCQVDLNDNQIPARVVFDSGSVMMGNYIILVVLALFCVITLIPSKRKFSQD